MKLLLRYLYRKWYGVRGGLKPPIGFYRIEHVSIFQYAVYRYRLRIWMLEEALYRWTGLPEEMGVKCVNIGSINPGEWTEVDV